MKLERHSKIRELIGKNEIGTQEELARYLREEGFAVTQATVSRDIRELKLTKVATDRGKQRYTVMQQQDSCAEKYVRVLQDGFLSMDRAQNLIVIKTVSGMAMAVAASLDSMQLRDLVGCIAGDDTIMCAVRTSEDAVSLMERIKRMISSAR